MDGATVVQWVPESAAALRRSERIVRTQEQPDIGIDTILTGLGVAILPTVAIWAGVVPIGERVLVGVAFGLVSALCCWLSLRGLYLSIDGVTVHGVLRHKIPWADIDHFELQARSLPFERSSTEWVTVVSTEGQAYRVLDLHRPVDFEGRHTPVRRVRDELRSYEGLVQHLNVIHDEVLTDRR